MSGAERIAEGFAAARADGRAAALMPYLMGGFPDLETSLRIGLAYAESGADLIELGVPFSDPLADGPVVHAAGTAALRAGASLDAVLELGRALADHVPVVLMLYANLIFARGTERFSGTKVSGTTTLWLPVARMPVLSHVFSTWHTDAGSAKNRASAKPCPAPKLRRSRTRSCVPTRPSSTPW